jgi:LPXTG-motif cell wall-anchored protein
MLQNEDENEGLTLSNGIFRWVLLGVALVFVGIVILVAALVLSGSGCVGVVIFIGPIPIVFGSGTNETWLILIGITLAIVSLVLFFVTKRRYGERRD